jgi:hypothetical protein
VVAVRFLLEVKKMTWNYRIIRQKDEYGESAYGICEVFYDEEGNAELWTGPVELYFDGDKVDFLAQILNAFVQPTLEERNEQLFTEAHQPPCRDKGFAEDCS